MQSAYLHLLSERLIGCLFSSYTLLNGTIITLLCDDVCSTTAFNVCVHAESPTALIASLREHKMEVNETAFGGDCGSPMGPLISTFAFVWEPF